MPKALGVESHRRGGDSTDFHSTSLFRDILGVEDPRLRVHSELLGEHTVLSRLSGALDTTSCWRLERETALVLSEPFTRWVLDLRQLHFLGISGIKALREISTRIAVTGAGLSIFGGCLQTRRALVLVDDLHRRVSPRWTPRVVLKSRMHKVAFPVARRSDAAGKDAKKIKKSFRDGDLEWAVVDIVGDG